MRELISVITWATNQQNQAKGMEMEMQYGSVSLCVVLALINNN